MRYETLLLEKDEHLLTVTLNRPQAGNALNTAMLTEMVDLMSGLYVNPQGVRCIIVTGAGDRIFCGGGDLKERKGMTDEAWRRQHALAEQMIRHIFECPVPIIGAINGAAFGGGCELTSAFDFAYASKNARFALTEVTLGIIPGSSGTQMLPRAVGMRRAKEIILTGEAFSAEEALEWGLVNRVCEPADLLAETKKTARRICDSAPRMQALQKLYLMLTAAAGIAEKQRVARLVEDGGLGGSDEFRQRWNDDLANDAADRQGRAIAHALATALGV